MNKSTRLLVAKELIKIAKEIEAKNIMAMSAHHTQG